MGNYWKNSLLFISTYGHNSGCGQTGGEWDVPSTKTLKVRIVLSPIFLMIYRTVELKRGGRSWPFYFLKQTMCDQSMLECSASK